MNEVLNYGYITNLSLVEYITVPTYLIIIFFISDFVKKKNIQKNSDYKYYTWGVFFKLVGAIVFCMVYIFYYKGGDTIGYYESARALTNLLLQKPLGFFTVINNKPSWPTFFIFTGTTGYPDPSFFFDPNTFFVTKLLVPIMLISFKSFILTSIILSWVSFTGIWRLYLLFCRYYREFRFSLALAILFVPSAIFWGSGILKDSITLSASGWFIYSFHESFIAKQKKRRYLVYLFVSAYFIISIKPYILIALIPGAFIWFFHQKISKISNKFLKYSTIPFIYALSIFIGYMILLSLGTLDIQHLLQEAVIKQTDLKRAEYRGSSFDIGTYDATIAGALSVTPAAIIAGIYRPFVWEAKNIVMFLSGIENLFYLGLTLLILIKLRFFRIFNILFNNPLVLFSLSYSILFSLIIGLSTSNFGALVRFKIPFLPEFVSSLVIIYHLIKKSTLKSIQNYF